MSLMGSLYVGLSGLQMGQNALNTTAHNMANVDTVGYTRQQVQQGTRIYNTISTSASAVAYQQIGLGVNYSQVKQVRDVFLDKAYRRESGRSGFYDTFAAAVEEVEDIFQELQGEAFAKTIENLWTSVQELAKDPANSVKQGVFVQRCNEFLTRSQAVYKSLSEYQDDLNDKIVKQVDTINAYGDRIAQLNVEIQKIEAGQIEKANDLRDERNQLIDELSTMAYIECRTDVSGNILIQLEGKDFVRAESANKIGLEYDENGFATPYWTQLAKTKMVNGVKTVTSTEGAKVFNMDRIISSSANTDIGSLKAMLYARGDHRATFRDLTAGSTYDRNISQSVVMNVQAEFDNLVHLITTGINDIFAKAAENARKDNPDSNYMRDPVSGEPYTIFNVRSEVYGTDNDFTTQNIIINGEIKQAPTLLGFKKDDGKVDQETADALKEFFMSEDHNINPNVKTKTNFIHYYDDMISLVANDGYVLRGISENQQITVDNVASAREQILGVSADEEMSNMVMFQNAYNAASRYINAVSEMLEHLIGTLGR